MSADRPPLARPERETVHPAEPAAEPADEPAEVSSAAIPDEAWDVFALDEDTIEPEPEYGDFWGEVDDDETI